MPPEGKPVRLHPDARAEMQQSVRFYRERGGERWVAEFEQQVAEGLNAIAANPERFPHLPDLPVVRKYRLKRFPFSVLYINRSEDIWVVAVAHGRREPGYWKQRIS